LTRTENDPVGAAEGCDLLILSLKKQNQKIAAFGSSYIDVPSLLSNFLIVIADNSA
jgi:hypothetical protein